MQPDCVTVNVLSPIAMLVERPVTLGLAAIAYVTVPDPVPLAPVRTVTQSALLAAVQKQPAAAVTDTLLDVRPEAGEEIPIGTKLTLQLLGGFCVMTKLCPPMITVPLRTPVDVFSPTL